MNRRLLAGALSMVLLASSCTGDPGGEEGSSTESQSNASAAKWSQIETASDIRFDDSRMVYMGIQGTEDWVQDILNTFKGFGGAPEFLYPVWEQRHQQLATKVTTGDSPDLYKYESGSGDWPNLIVAGQVMCVDDLVDYNSPLFADLKPMYDEYKIGGKGYLLPNSVQVFRGFILYNKNLFEDAGLETPFELYQKGEWTMDKMEEYAKAFTIVKDGVQESIGMFATDEGPFVAATGRDIFQRNENGEFVSNIKDPLIAKAMERIQRMYRDEQCLTMNYSIARDLMIKGKMAMFAGPFWNIDTLKILTNSGALELVPFPKDPEADKWYLDGLVDAQYIPRGAKNPDAALAWIAAQTEYRKKPETIAKEEQEMTAKYHMSADMGALYTDMQHGSTFTYKYLVYKNFDGFYEKFYNEFWDNLIQGESWSAIAERLAPAVDTEIKKLQAMN